MSLFDIKAIVEPFVAEARAADRRRRLEYLHLLELKRRSIVKNRIKAGDSLAEAQEFAQTEIGEAFEAAKRWLEASEVRRG